MRYLLAVVSILLFVAGTGFAHDSVFHRDLELNADTLEYAHGYYSISDGDGGFTLYKASGPVTETRKAYLARLVGRFRILDETFYILPAYRLRQERRENPIDVYFLKTDKFNVRFLDDAPDKFRDFVFNELFNGARSEYKSNGNFLVTLDREMAIEESTTMFIGAAYKEGNSMEATPHFVIYFHQNP